MKRILTAYIFFFLLVAGVHLAAAASTVAVFPVEDLSMGRNSVNAELTTYLANELENRGLNVVPEKAVFSFMARNRIRHLGYLDTEEVTEAAMYLGVDYVLVGSVSQLGEKISSVGLTISLIRAADAYMIWTGVDGVSIEDEQRLLGISAPQNIADLLPLLAKNIFSDWPADLELLAQERKHNFYAENPDTVMIESVVLEPKAVRPGEEVKCLVQLKQMGNEAEQPQVFFKAGNKVYLAMRTEEGRYYEAAWVGDGQQGQNVQIALAGSGEGLFQGIWGGYDQDADYPVSLVLKWSSGKQVEKYLGSYEVDSKPPEVGMIVKGLDLNGTIAFRDELPIFIRWINREPVSRWEVSVADEFGNIKLINRGNGRLPYKFIWEGQANNKAKVDEGIYTITVKAWDRAGNMSSSSEKVLFKPNPPQVSLAVKHENNRYHVGLASESDVPLSYWRIEFWTESYELIKQVEGTQLPTEIELSALEMDKSKIECVMVVRDMLGNYSRQAVDDINQITALENKGDEDTQDASAKWNVNF